MTALDWAAKIVDESVRDLAESFPTAARNWDWRVAEALMNRTRGRPAAVIGPHPTGTEWLQRRPIVIP
jgi:hypothetical protein